MLNLNHQKKLFQMVNYVSELMKIYLFVVKQGIIHMPSFLLTGKGEEFPPRTATKSNG